ncbi:MAG: class I SAM-dependent methyltransferase [Paracoccaceae bacterium]
MLSSVTTFLSGLESGTALSSRQSALTALRPLGLGDFGSVLWQMPMPEFPNLSQHLPPMSPLEVQKKWTGASGQQLLINSVPFVQSCSENYTALTGKSLKEARILDFGCGYGRFLRLFSYYSDEVWGCDPWEMSLEQSRAAGFADRVRKSDTMPDNLPFDEGFDFAFAFSIFTHLNQRAATACLRALRTAMKPSGVLCITIRPPEYWTGHFAANKTAPPDSAKRFMTAHDENGFAFFPHGAKPDDPDATYGDTSMTIATLRRIAPGWEIAAMDRTLTDPMQHYIFLRAV